MESAERLTTSTPSSATSSSPSTPSVAVVVSKGGLSAGVTPLSSTITACGRSQKLLGHLFRTSGDQPFNLSSAFPMVSHPIFGLHAASSGHSEFGGLGTLGTPTALAAHPQLAPFPEWWRATDAHTRAAFFPPLLGIPPLFTPPTPNHDSSFHLRNSVKNGRGIAEKGMNGSLNGSSPTLVTSNCTSVLSTTSTSTVGQTKSVASGAKGRLSKEEQSKADGRSEKTKDKQKQRKKAAESSSSSDSGSSSDTSSDGVSSSDSDDLEEEEDQSIEESDDDDDDSDSESEAQTKNKNKVLLHNLKTDGNKPEKSQEKRTHQQIPLISDSQTHVPFQSQQKHPQVLSQHLPFAFPSSQAKEETVNKHTSVIQCTGLISNVKPLTLLNHSNKDNCLKLGTPSTDGVKVGTKNTSEESAPSDLRIKKKDQHKATFPAHVSKPQESSKHQKKSFAGLQVSKSPYSSLSPHKTENNHSNPFLANALLGNNHPNGVLPNIIQDVPLALTTKAKRQGKLNDSSASSPGSQFSSPINLCSSVRKTSSSQSLLGPTNTPVLQSICKEKPPGKPNSPAIKTSHRVSAAKSLLDKFRGADSDIPSSKDSDDSNEEEEEDDDEDDEEEDEDDEEDDSDSQSESDSNSESDSDGSEEDDDKDQDDSDSDTEGEKTPSKLNKTAPSMNSTSNSITAHSTPLNLQVIKNPGSAPVSLCPEAQTQEFLASSSTLSPSTPCGSGKRRKVTDEHELGIPLKYGWQRETRIKNFSGRLQGEVNYYAPCGKKFRQYPEVMKYLSRNGIMDISRDNFSFSAKIRVGDFYEARDGPQGMQWYLLKEEEIVPRIRAMEGRRGRPPNPDKKLAREESRMRRRKGRPPNVGSADFVVNDDAKLLRKLQAQEIARQAAQIKLLRKLQRQEQARAAKEAKKQQAKMAAEEKRKQKEQIKILKQQEKIKRIEQVRMEKELRAQQILEAKKKKKEEAAIARIMEAKKRIKAKEMRRQQAVLLKHQERERRRQHVMLLKAVEARKKAEERERLKQEKQDEKRLNKERKLEQRRLELELAKELKKPTEDMCLADQKPFPELPRIPGLVLSGSTFSNCLMVVQFLRNFGKVLDFDMHKDIPTLSVLQEGLLNMGDSMGEVQDLLVRLLSVAVCDPGVPPGYKAKTALGEHILNIGINRDNVSEVLQIFMEAHCGQTDITESLKTKAFQAHTPEQKSTILAFLVNELACSKSVVSEIDKNIDHMSNLRKDKWMVEGKLRKLRMIHAKKTGKKESTAGSEGSEEQQSLGTPTQGRKRRRKGADSDYDDDDDDDDSDDQAEDEDEEDEEKKGKKVETCDDEDDGDQTATVEELEKQIDKLLKQQNQYRKKLFESSHCLRSMMFGQDRYRRRYWILPQCGGMFVEGMQSGEGPEELAKERERQKAAENIQIKEEMLESYEEKVNCLNSGNRDQKDKDSTNLFLQKPGSFSKLSKLLEVAKMSPEMDVLAHKASVSPNVGSLPYKNNCRATPNNLQPSTSQGNTEKQNSSSFTPPLSGSGKFSNSPVIPNEQLLKTLTDKNRQWFSLLPRTPCDDTSLTYIESSPAVTTMAQCRLPSQPPSPLPSPVSNQSPVQTTLGINPFTLSTLQMKPGLQLMGLQFCGWPSPVVPANIPFSSPVPGMGLTASEGSSHSFLTPNTQPSKSESPIAQSDKSICTPPSTVEVPKQVDFQTPRPIPEEMQLGWWRVTDPEDLKSLLKVLHLRGIREKSLQKQIQKHLEYITQTCMKTKDVTIIEMNGPEECQLTQDIVENWSVEDQEMEVDLSILQQIEDLERRVASASLQVKGWMYPEPASEREDLVYYEHKSVSKSHKEHGGEHTTDEGGSFNAIERKSDNPLDIAVTRLTDLERNIERRYLKSPLSTTIQIKLDNVGTVTVPAPAPSINGDGDGTEDDIAPGLKIWRKAISEARSVAQVSLCIQQLQKSIAWEKSIMKVYCQICRKGDNEELLLLCDGCDKGCHTYCHRPKITTIPEGDWFCPACIAKASGHTLKTKKSNLKGKKSMELKKGKKSPGDTGEEDSTVTGTPGKKGSKDSKKRKGEENNLSPSKQESSPSSKKARSTKDESKDLSLCSVILSDMESHEDAWPFLLPVNLKLVPGYKKVIKKPMDFATIRDKLSNGQYPNFEAFALDVRLVFNNCETFNEDDSEIGRAGHKMRVHFEKRWTELFNMS
ncbi:bromodomain adjacent to zinc finger domain protein 2B isoform X6 [Xenopus laevis]|uniref:Bromodomain adjacent to zinc finger domain protein 2B isoform X6 n=1 Tax=Xenopus laevis TaxID=8355 RepID=A0A8J0TT25_XENLA|nr:bromodomain adjacent to zinc finger domain protein 2B isoform X6 [Xenopus laevis]